jgi:hypothetical protein
VPASIKLQREYGSDLQVIFVESQGANSATAEAFAWRQKWMGTEAMWTTERPLEVEGNGLPQFALLDTEGNLLFSGNPLAKKKQIEESIAEQVEKAKDPPAGTPPKLAKAWATFVKGGVGAAIAECDKVGAADAALAEAAKSLRAEMVARTDIKVARGKWMLDNGYVAEATDLLTALGKSVKGCSDFDAKIADELARLALPDDELGAEAEASKALAALQKKMIDDKPFEEGHVKALARLAEKYAGTKAGARAARLVELSKIKV